MDNLENYFYKNQDIILETPKKKFKGYVGKIEGRFLYIVLYASFSAEGRVSEFGEDGYDLDGDVSLIRDGGDFTLINPGFSQTFLYKPLLEEIVKNVDGISLKMTIAGEQAERKGREFLRISAVIQFIYEEISMEEFLETKAGYISRPSFTTSVYGIYNIASPKIYQPASGDGDADSPINPRMENLLIAINSKLDVILSLLNPETSIFADVKEKPVFISGSGIMWTESPSERPSGTAGGAVDKTPELRLGSIIKITMLFSSVPQFVIKALAQVVKIIDADDGLKDEDKKGKISVACKFIAINESDRDEIIKFTLEKQRQQIKRTSF